MVSAEGIQYDIERAREAAFVERDWDVLEWSRQSEVSAPTIRKFLAGDPSVKFSTVHAIVKPLGLTALELIRKNGKKK